MGIKHKLLLGFGFFILVYFAGGSFTLRELHIITKKLRLVERANEIENLFLDSRRLEKNYLLFHNPEHFEELDRHVRMLRVNIDTMADEIAREIGAEKMGGLKRNLREYQTLLQLIAENHAGQLELTGQLAGAGDAIEAALPSEALQDFLALRGAEKNLLLRQDVEAYEAFTATHRGIRARLPWEAERYAAFAERLHRLYVGGDRMVASLRQVARDIESSTKTLASREQENIERALRTQRRLLYLLLAVTTLIGATASLRLSSSIATPIRELERITKKLARKDFSEVISPRGNDEIASLGHSFNEMAQQLKDTLVSLELAIDNLHGKQEALVEAEKLASLGRVTAGVAHEINNPLAIINEKAGLMRDIIELSPSFPEAERFQRLIDGITANVVRCRNITHRLLGAARRTDVVRAPFRLADAIRDVSEFLEKEMLFKGIEYAVSSPENLPPVTSDREQVVQVLLNIVKNAIDAVERGGRISVSAAERENGTQTLTVRDNGPGIPPERIRNVFEPFHTTKDRGKGTGLGLFVSYAIMKKLGGSISVWSEVDKGTTFVIEVPGAGPQGSQS